MYDAIQERINDYEKEILHRLAEMERLGVPGPSSAKVEEPTERASQNRGEEPMRQALYRMSGAYCSEDSVGLTLPRKILRRAPDVCRHDEQSIQSLRSGNQFQDIRLLSTLKWAWGAPATGAGDIASSVGYLATFSHGRLIPQGDNCMSRLLVFTWLGTMITVGGFLIAKHGPVVSAWRRRPLNPRRNGP